MSAVPTPGPMATLSSVSASSAFNAGSNALCMARPCRAERGRPIAYQGRSGAVRAEYEETASMVSRPVLKSELRMGTS
jgi:hypothetical protein